MTRSNRVMGMIDHRAFEQCFVNWTTMSIELTKGVVINVDGNKLRSSATKQDQQTAHKDGGKSAVHLVETWCGACQMCLAQYTTANKSNEITAVPVILDWLELKDGIVTIDAMGCQRSIAAKMVTKDAHYILASKENQEGLYLAVGEMFDQTKVDETSANFFERQEQSHGRLKKQTCRVLSAQSIPSQDWKGLKTVIEIISERMIVASKQRQTEKRYYISSLQTNAEDLNQKIRGHWQIENQLHWIMEVVLGEDTSRKRSRNSAQNFGVIRRIALNILKSHPEKISVNRKMVKTFYLYFYLVKYLSYYFYYEKDLGTYFTFLLFASLRSNVYQ